MSVSGRIANVSKRRIPGESGMRHLKRGIASDNQAQNPVGLLVDCRNGLLVADDVGNAIWRIVLPEG